MKANDQAIATILDHQHDHLQSEARRFNTTTTVVDVAVTLIEKVAVAAVAVIAVIILVA